MSDMDCSLGDAENEPIMAYEDGSPIVLHDEPPMRGNPPSKWLTAQKARVPVSDELVATDADVIELLRSDQELDVYRRQIIRCKQKAYAAYVEVALEQIESSQLPLCLIHEGAMASAESQWQRFS